MSSARHFRPAGSTPDDQLKAEITADLAAARGAQRDLKSAGQYGVADRMAATVDEHLDELNAANNGTWQPRHG